MRNQLRPNMIDTTRALRQRGTLAERVLWEALRNRKVAGLKFRRQHQIGKFVVDFYCPELKLVIEVDGGAHWTEQGLLLDREREAALRPFVRHILRLSNNQVTENMAECLQKMAEVVGRLRMGEII